MADYKTSPEIERAAKIIKYQKNAQESKTYNVMKAYIDAAEKNLNAKDGEPDYKLLENKDVREKHVESIVESLQKHYTKHTGIDLKDVEKRAPGYSDQLFQMHYGIDKANLKNLANQQGKDFTALAFVGTMQQQISKLTEQHINAATSEIKVEHLDDIVKYTGIDASLINKGKIGHDETRNLLQQYLVNDEVSKKWLEQQPYHLKKDEGKSKKPTLAKMDKKEPISFKKAA
ncbi:MAG: hypothetical protein ACLFNM_03930 [Candidatus Woesearchaeota archaeon]